MTRAAEQESAPAPPDAAALRQELAYWRDLFETVGEALLVHDADGRVLAANRQACALFRCTREQAMAVSIGALSEGTPPHGQAEALEHLARALRDGQHTFEWRSRRLDGEPFWSEVALRAGTLAGRPRVVACVRDVTARREAEAALRASEEKLARIFHGSSNAIAFTDAQGAILEVNDTWVARMGIARERAVGRTALQLGLWGSAAEGAGMLERLERDGRFDDVDAAFQTPAGPRTFTTSAEYVELRGGRFLLWELRDQTARRRAEEQEAKLRAQLEHAQKMDSVGRLAGGVAHDFNNLLTVINGCSDMLLHALPHDDPRREEVLEIRQAGERAAALTQQLLAFSRQQVLQPRLLRLNAVVGDAERLLRRVLGEDVELAVVLDPSMGTVRADPNQLVQVLVNLAVNARDAMPGGGRLTLETAQVEVARPPAPGEEAAGPGPHACLAVSDTGCGMDAATQRRLFEPFFTTKARGAGTGLGLSTAYGIVRQSGGWIAVESEVGRGSTFRVYLPVVRGTPEELAAPATAARGTGTVLLVEDQPEVRRVTARMLQAAGFQVLEAGGGEEGVGVASAFPGAIDLLITDVVMPGISGRSLADLLAASRPALRVLFVSGYTPEVIVHHGVLEEGLAFLQKPFTAAALVGKIREVLDQPPPPEAPHR